MKRILFLLSFPLLLTTPLCAQSFKTLWKRVETSMSQDLPETAREQVKTIRAIDGAKLRSVAACFAH